MARVHGPYEGQFPEKVKRQQDEILRRIADERGEPFPSRRPRRKIPEEEKPLVETIDGIRFETWSDGRKYANGKMIKGPGGVPVQRGADVPEVEGLPDLPKI